jgi:hypothetical protein
VRRNPRVSVAGGTFHLYCRPARGEQPLVGNEATIDEMGYLVPMRADSRLRFAVSGMNEVGAAPRLRSR